MREVEKRVQGEAERALNAALAAAAREVVGRETTHAARQATGDTGLARV